MSTSRRSLSLAQLLNSQPEPAEDPLQNVQDEPEPDAPQDEPETDLPPLFPHSPQPGKSYSRLLPEPPAPAPQPAPLPIWATTPGFTNWLDAEGWPPPHELAPDLLLELFTDFQTALKSFQASLGKKTSRTPKNTENGQNPAAPTNPQPPIPRIPTQDSGDGYKNRTNPAEVQPAPAPHPFPESSVRTREKGQPETPPLLPLHQQADGSLHAPLHALRESPALRDWPELSPDQFASLQTSIASEGILVPLLVTPYGEILDGKHRLRCARHLGLDSIPVRVRENADPLAIAIETGLNGRALPPAGRALLLIEHHPALAGYRQHRKSSNLRHGGACLANQTARLAGQTALLGATISFKTLSQTYQVNKNLFTEVSRLYEAADPETWAKIRHAILHENASPARLVAGQAGRDATKGHKRSEPDPAALILRTLREGALRWTRWNTIPQEARPEIIEEARRQFATLPPEIRARLRKMSEDEALALATQPPSED